jgi:type IV pilus assembly protein PilA
MPAAEPLPVDRERFIPLSRGFSLIEIVVVVAAIGILASLALSSYMHFRKKAIVTEARATLKNIYDLEFHYQSENDTYTTSLDDLGFQMVGRARYSYIVVDADSSGFTARATSNLDSDPDLDIWIVNDTGTLKQINAD